MSHFLYRRLLALAPNEQTDTNPPNASPTSPATTAPDGAALARRFKRDSEAYSEYFFSVFRKVAKVS